MHFIIHTRVFFHKAVPYGVQKQKTKTVSKAVFRYFCSFSFLFFVFASGHFTKTALVFVNWDLQKQKRKNEDFDVFVFCFCTTVWSESVRAKTNNGSKKRVFVFCFCTPYGTALFVHFFLFVMYL